MYTTEVKKKQNEGPKTEYKQYAYILPNKDPHLCCIHEVFFPQLNCNFNWTGFLEYIQHQLHKARNYQKFVCALEGWQSIYEFIP